MIQSRFNNYNLRLYEIIKHYSSYCMSVFTNSHPGFDKDWFLMRWQKTLEQLEDKLKIQETNLTHLTRHNANMQKTIVTFVKNEKQLVADLNQVKVDTRAKDQKIAELELKLHEIIIKNEELVKENEDVNDKNTHLIRKFNY